MRLCIETEAYILISSRAAARQVACEVNAKEWRMVAVCALAARVESLGVLSGGCTLRSDRARRAALPPSQHVQQKHYQVAGCPWCWNTKEDLMNASVPPGPDRA